MSNEMWVAVISGVLPLLGTIFTVWLGNSKTMYRIEQLEKKQDKHNCLIERMYNVEDRLNVIDEKIKVVNHRIDDLENEQ